MTHIEINPEKVKPAVIDLIAGSLAIGQILVLPTDTIYGLSCLADSVRPIKKIYRLKKRDVKKPLSVLVSSLKMAKKYVAISKKQLEFLKKIWAKDQEPTTVILKHLKKLPRELTRGSDGLAIRLPKNKILIKIIKKVDCPLVSTSLNLSGEKDIKNFSKLSKYFPQKNNRPDLVIESGPAPRRQPSRLVDLRNEDKPIIIRK